MLRLRVGCVLLAVVSLSVSTVHAQTFGGKATDAAKKAGQAVKTGDGAKGADEAKDADEVKGDSDVPPPVPFGAPPAGAPFGGPAPGGPFGGGGAPMHPVMQAIDVDGDGTLSAKEIRAAAKALLKLDLNHDKQLTPDELMPGGGPGPMGGGGMFGGPGEGKKVDARGPGDAAAGAAAGAGAFGAPGGGFGIPMPVPGTGGNAGGGGFNRVPGSNLPLSAKQLMAMDKDGDRRISKEELPPQIWAIYERFDLNRDGTLDPRELHAAAGRN